MWYINTAADFNTGSSCMRQMWQFSSEKLTVSFACWSQWEFKLAYTSFVHCYVVLTFRNVITCLRSTSHPWFEVSFMFILQTIPGEILDYLNCNGISFIIWTCFSKQHTNQCKKYLLWHKITKRGLVWDSELILMCLIVLLYFTWIYSLIYHCTDLKTLVCASLD